MRHLWALIAAVMTLLALVALLDGLIWAALAIYLLSWIPLLAWGAHE